MLPLLSLLLSISQSTSASPFPQTVAGSNDACSKIQSSLINPPPTSSPYGVVPAQIAWDCLQSIPINNTVALSLIETIKPYLKFQSTTIFAAHPPLEYIAKVQKPVDIWKGLDGIAVKLKANLYRGEWQFGWDLYTLLQSVHDGHLSYYPDSVAGVFQWFRPVPIVSVSEDGNRLPSAFVHSDVLLAATNKKFKPSAIRSINGRDVEDYLEELAQFGSLQDRDALYNTLFYNLPTISLGPSGLGSGVFTGGGRGRVVYPGPTTTLRFANGTSLTFQNLARVQRDFTNFKTGLDVYNDFDIGGEADEAIDILADQPDAKVGRNIRIPNIRTKPQVDLADPVGYPKPLFRSVGNEIGGYYLEGKGYENVAVLSVQAFSSADDDLTEFQRIGRSFLQKAHDDGKTKLIIDVSANGGGTIWLGYELFLQLFPDFQTWGINRFRGSFAFDEMGKVFSAVGDKFPNPSEINSPEIFDVVASNLNYRTDLDEDNRRFRSWQQKYGPNVYTTSWGGKSDNFTTNQRWDLNSPLREYYSGLKELTSKGLPSLGQLFKREDVLLVSDGYCASTCSIFAEFLRQQVQVDTLTFGGRSNRGIVQAVGGVKGTNIWPWNWVLQQVQYAIAFADAATRSSWRGTEIARFNSLIPFRRAVGSPGVNSRDGIRHGDATGTPLQFWYEPADCRLFYTADMTVDITAQWRAAADTKWLGKRRCVAGGFRDVKSSQPRWKRAEAEAEKSTTVEVLTSLKDETVEKLKKAVDIVTDFVPGRKADGVMVP